MFQQEVACILRHHEARGVLWCLWWQYSTLHCRQDMTCEPMQHSRDWGPTSSGFGPLSPRSPTRMTVSTPCMYSAITKSSFISLMQPCTSPMMITRPFRSSSPSRTTSCIWGGSSFPALCMAAGTLERGRTSFSGSNAKTEFINVSHQVEAPSAHCGSAIQIHTFIN